MSGVVAGYDRRHPVIHDLTVTVQAGESLALAGPSGSGKSTLARVLSLLHQPFAGTVSVNGRQVPGYRHRAPLSYAFASESFSSNRGCRSIPA